MIQLFASATTLRQTRGRVRFAHVRWLLLFLLTLGLWLPNIGPLWDIWHSDPSLGQGPLIPVIAAILLWNRRAELRRWDAASGPGLALLVTAGLLTVAATWADIDFLKPLALILLGAGLIWFLGGPQTLLAAAGPLGFLAFMIPWPTTVTDKLGFPLQLASSAYAAQFGGMLGLPIVRDGVHLAVMPHLDAKPLYQMLVVQQCSGLTSLLVLLALGYLIAYHTPVRLGWRLAMIALIVPLTLLLNALRLTIILLMGAYYSAATAQWVHDHEQPVLVFLCSIGLLGLRHVLLQWPAARLSSDEAAGES